MYREPDRRRQAQQYHKEQFRGMADCAKKFDDLIKGVDAASTVGI